LQGRVKQDIAVVGAGKLLNGAASFFIRIYTVRFLDPAPYGALSLGLNCLMLFDALAGAALDLGTMSVLTGSKPCETRQIQPAEKAAIRLKMAIGLALVAVFLFAGEWLGFRFLHAPGGRAYFLVLTAGGTLILLVRSAQLYFQARLRFRMFAAIDIMHSSLRVLLVGAVLIRGAASALSILGCYVIAPAVVVVVFLVYGYVTAGWRQVRPQWEDGRAVLKPSAPIFVTFGVSSLVSRLDVFLLALRSTPVQLGLYGAALTIATIPEIIGAYLAPVFLPRILPSCKAGAFFNQFRRFHLLAFAVVSVAFALALIAGRPVMSVFLPVKYTPSIFLVLVLLPGTLAAASFFPLTLNFMMLIRPRSFLIVDSVAAPFLIVAYFFLAPVYGALAVAWITCAHRFVKAAIVQVWAYRLAKHSTELRPVATNVQPV
jgi:O-antigen/teichoic acid export membrane protein